MKRLSKSKWFRIISCMLLVAVLGLGGGLLAFLSDADTATNTFTVGKISIDLQEPNWNENNAIELTPNKEVVKDPQILNDGKNPAYVFLEVRVPYGNLVTANRETGEKLEAKDTELWSYDVKDGWTEVVTPSKDSTSGYVTHLYVWGTLDNCTELAMGDTTGTLFDYVRFANVVEEQGLEEASKDIIINAYGIQTKNILDGKTGLDGANDDGKVSAEEVWSVLNNQAPTTDKPVVTKPVYLTTGKAFNRTIPEGTTSVVFTDEAFPTNETATKDVSLARDGSILAWMDGTTYKVSSGSADKEIYANPSCENMFCGYTGIYYSNKACGDINSIAFDNFNTSNVTSMKCMFYRTGYRARSFTVDLSEWDVSNVTTMREMFLESGWWAATWSIGDISHWNVSHVTNMASMFREAGDRSTNFTTLDLSGWNTSSATIMDSMFDGCGYLTTIYVGDNWNVDKVTDSDSTNMFYRCQSLVGQSGTTYDSSKIDKAMANYETGYLTYKAPKIP